jgi:hypothetical protein
MDSERYGSRLGGYSLNSNYKGTKLYRFNRWNGQDHESKLGLIKSTETETHGPVTITIWTLENGEKYHYLG